MTDAVQGSSKRRSFSKWTYGGAIGLVASILTILTYFGLTPILEKKMLDKKEQKQVSIGNVSGNVVISQNQSGGITAHSITINETSTPE